jgi:hypothetical protein
MPALGGWITVCVNGKDRAVEPDKELPAEPVPRGPQFRGVRSAEVQIRERSLERWSGRRALPLECDGLAAGSCRSTGLPASPASSTSGKHAKKGSNCAADFGSFDPLSQPKAAFRQIV